jgi:hypothetical protein
VSVEDLEEMFLTSAKTAAGRAGYAVHGVKLKLGSDHSRSLSCEMRISGMWPLLPTSFKLTGRIDVDDAYNAHISNITCSGEDVGGLLLAGFLSNSIKKYDGRVMPLTRFPEGKIGLTALRIEADDSLRIFASFANHTPAAGAETKISLRTRR